MKFKGIFMLICLIVCLFTMASLSAGDIDDGAIGSADEIEVSKNDEMADDLQASEENQILNEKDDGTFKALDDKIKNASEGSTLYLENDYCDNNRNYQITIEKTITIDGQGHTIDANSKSRIFFVLAENVVLKNLILKNGKVSGSEQRGAAIYGQCTSINCTFINNFVDAESAAFGGAIFEGTAINCTFINNEVFGRDGAYGGAIYRGTAINCNFIENKATSIGTACGGLYQGTAINCTFIDNIGSEYSSAMCYGCATDCNLISDTLYWDVTQINTHSGDSAYLSVQDCNLNSGERLFFDLKNGDTIWNSAYTTITLTKNDFKTTFHALSGDGWLVDLTPGTYEATFSIYGAEKYISPKTIKLTVLKKTAKITAKDTKTTYNKKKYLTVTLTDDKNMPINGQQITITVKTPKTYTTDANGQVKINVGKLTPKTYNVKITFKENTDFKASQKTVKITVKKAKSKIKAKKKTLKKAKKYKITLKSGKKPIKKVKVTLKIKKKTFKAKTNKKGKATFKLKKLSKKGTFKATIKFKGNKYYKKATKKVKITIK